MILVFAWVFIKLGLTNEVFKNFFYLDPSIAIILICVLPREKPSLGAKINGTSNESRLNWRVTETYVVTTEEDRTVSFTNMRGTCYVGSFATANDNAKHGKIT